MHRFLGAALLCGAALVASAPAAAAPKKTTEVGFLIAPVGHPSLRFSSQPGETITGRVRIQNLANRSRTIRLTAADLITADTGGASFPAAPPKAVGSWLELDDERVRLAARSATTVTFLAHVPATAKPGQHYAGIVAVDAADAANARKPSKKRDGVEIKHLARLALPVRLTVPGPQETAVALTEMLFSVDASGSSLRIGMRNAGNRIIRETDINLNVSRNGRKLLTIRNQLLDFITYSAISYPVAWRGQLNPGSYHVTGVIRPKGGPPVSVDETVDFTPKLAKTLEQRTGTPAPPSDGQPVWMWLSLAVVLTAGGAITTAYVRLRRRLRTAV